MLCFLCLTTYHSDIDLQVVVELILGMSTLPMYLVLYWALPTAHAISSCWLELRIALTISRSQIAQLII
jgi:hypothetical protein